jgi:hypothetical protein
MNRYGLQYLKTVFKMQTAEYKIQNLLTTESPKYD